MEKQVLFLVLNKIEILDRLLIALNKAGVRGATVVSSIGMAHAIANCEESHIISSMRAFFVSDREENKIVFMVVDDEGAATARKVIHEVVGDLSKPDTGIMFSIPTLFVEGLR